MRIQPYGGGFDSPYHQSSFPLVSALSVATLLLAMIGFVSKSDVYLANYTSHDKCVLLAFK